VAQNRTDHVIHAGHERDGHVRRHAWKNITWQLLFNAHARDLEIVITLAVIRDVERHDAGRECRRHVNVVFILGNAHDRPIDRLCVAFAVGGVLGTRTARNNEPEAANNCDTE